MINDFAKPLLFTEYTDNDSRVLNLMSGLGLILTGGTAVEILLNSEGFIPGRKRSENDFDYFYYTLDDKTLARIKGFGFELLSSTLDTYNFVLGSEIELDLLHNNNRYSSVNVGGIAIIEPICFFISKFNRYLEFRLASTTRQDVVNKITTDEIDLLDLLRLFDRYGEQYVSKFELQMGQYINAIKSRINKTAAKVYLSELVDKCMAGKPNH